MCRALLIRAAIGTVFLFSVLVCSMLAFRIAWLLFSGENAEQKRAERLNTIVFKASQIARRFSEPGSIVSPLAIGREMQRIRSPLWRATQRNKRLAVIVPYRDREEDLPLFLEAMDRHLRQLGVHDFRIYIVEQHGHARFNRAMLLNIGAAEALLDFRKSNDRKSSDNDVQKSSDNDVVDAPKSYHINVRKLESNDVAPKKSHNNDMPKSSDNDTLKSNNDDAKDVSDEGMFRGGERRLYFALHDVDMVPAADSVDYGYTSGVRHLATCVAQFGYDMPYRTYSGGVLLVNAGVFERVNGFSLSYWGWGGEDDDFYQRCRRHGIRIEWPYPYCANMMNNTHPAEKSERVPDPDRQQKLESMLRSGSHQLDGLNGVSRRYRVLERNVIDYGAHHILAQLKMPLSLKRDHALSY
jgi:N-terminal domain of galactosyltransferase/N-terminal region of glycosyl transferase group 7